MPDRADSSTESMLLKNRGISHRSLTHATQAVRSGLVPVTLVQSVSARRQSILSIKAAPEASTLALGTDKSCNPQGSPISVTGQFRLDARFAALFGFVRALVVCGWGSILGRTNNP